MSRFVIVLACVILLGCGDDKNVTNTPTTTVVRLFKSDHFAVEIHPPITQHAGCVPCDQIAHPGCQNIDPDGSCGMGQVYATVGCSWQHGERIRDFSLGSFDLRSVDRVTVGIYGGGQDPEYLGTTVHGETWYESTNLNSFIGQNNVSLKVKFHAQFQDGEEMAPPGERLSLCPSPSVYLDIDSVVVRAYHD